MKDGLKLHSPLDQGRHESRDMLGTTAFQSLAHGRQSTYLMDAWAKALIMNVPELVTSSPWGPRPSSEKQGA